MSLGFLGDIQFNAQFFSALISIVIIDLVLAGDNAVVIAMAVKKLQGRQRTLGIAAGAGGRFGDQGVAGRIAEGEGAPELQQLSQELDVTTLNERRNLAIDRRRMRVVLQQSGTRTVAERSAYGHGSAAIVGAEPTGDSRGDEAAPVDAAIPAGGHRRSPCLLVPGLARRVDRARPVPERRGT